jgi:tetratricopeptide (TPR) repeat protein
MFRFGYDILAANAPDWYSEADKNILKENYLEAGRIAKDAAKTYKDSGDNDGEALAICSYVKALVIEEDAWNARKYATDALELAKAKEMKAALTHLLARIALKERKNGDAAKHGQAALQMYQELGSEKGELSATITNAAICVAKGDLLEAEKIAVASREKAVALGDLRAKAAALYLNYEIAIKDEVPSSAVEWLDYIIEVYTELADPLSVGIAMLMAAETQRLEGELQSTMDRAAEAAQKFDEAVDGVKKGHAVLCMAKAFHEAQQYEDSLEAATAALHLYKATRNKEGQAEALRILADCSLKKGKDIKDSLYKMEEVSFLYRQLKNKKKEADALNEVTKIQVQTLALGASELGEPLRRARRAAQLYDEDYAGDTLGNAEANLTVANIYLSMQDDFEEGLQFVQRSHEVFEKLGNKSGAASALTTWAKLQFASGNKEEGAKMAERALDIAQDSGDKNLQSLALDIVEHQGKEKPLKTVEHSDIILIIGPTRIAFFDEFESRRARYKSMDNKEAGKPAISDSKLDTQAITSAKSKVEYTIRWQLVPNLDLSKMPIPK